MDVFATIPQFFERDGVAFYELQISCRSMGALWRVEKRYSQFAALRDSLSRKFPSVPELPPKTLMRTTDAEFLKFRQQHLATFLQAVTKRTDLVASAEVREFLQVEKNVPEAVMQEPEKVFEEHIAKPISDAYLTSSKIIYTQYESNPMFRMDAYISRIKIPFLKPEREYVSYTEVNNWSAAGLSLVYRAAHDYVSTALCYEEELGLILVGFDTGDLHGFLTTSEDPVLQLKPHSRSITTILLSPNSRQLLTSSLDKRITVIDLNSRTTLSTVQLTETPLSMAWYSPHVVVTFPHTLQLYNYSDEGLLMVDALADQTQAGLEITCTRVVGNVAFIGTTSGTVVVFQLDKRKETGKLHWTGKVTGIVCSLGRKEVMVGNDSGKVATFSIATGALLHVLEADYTIVTYLGWDESSQTLFTSGEQRKLKAFKMPSSWQVLVAESLTDTVDETISQRLPPSDDLEGWDS